MELAILNGLEYPFLVYTVRDGTTATTVKALGENLLIPVATEVENAPLYQLQQGYDRILGEDIDLFQATEFINLSDTEQGEMIADRYGDLKTVKGIQNLRQALIMRLMTPEGGLLHHPDYGSRFHLLLGQAGTPNNLQKVKIEIERCLRADPRVDDVIVSSVQLNGDIATATIAVKPIDIDQIVQLGLNMSQKGVITWA